MLGLLATVRGAFDKISDKLRRPVFSIRCRTRVSCKHCCVKKSKRTQKPDENPEFYHQMLGAVIVHPERSTVLPLEFEPITRAVGKASAL